MVNNDRILYSFIHDFLNIAALSKNGNARNIFKKLQEDFNVQGSGYPKAAAGKYIGTANIIDKLVLYL
ncbi:MAG: hypothetical protein PUB48_07170 [Solobacterium sp.]|nr:hypothetical protein [Solobacterium sp.]